MSSASLRRRLELIAAVLATFLCAYRFANLDLVTFINDEPSVLAAAREEVAGKGWALASPAAGTQGLHYGPVPTWFYGVVQSLFGPRPLVSIVAMGLFVTLGQIAFAGLLARMVRGGALVYAITLGLFAVSPFDFAWSRTAWDNTILLATFGTGVLLFVENPTSWKRALGIGALFGLAIGSHLMVLPALAILFATTLWLRRREWKSVVGASAIVGVVALVINVPFLLYLFRRHAEAPVVTATTTNAPPHVHVFSLGEAVATIVTTFFQPARILTTSGISYFFDDAWYHFELTIGIGRVLTYDAWWAFVLAALAFAGLYGAARAKDERVTPLAITALAMWLGYALFLLVDGLDPHPHYQHPIAWTIPTGVALFFLRLRESSAKSGIATTSFGVVLALHAAFLPLWMHYVRANGGTAGIHYTTPLADEEAFVRAACAKGDSIALENRTVIFPAALRYLTEVEPACNGKTIRICEAGLCPRNTIVVPITYAEPIGGRLVSP